MRVDPISGLLYEHETTVDGAVAPGTGETPGDPPDPSAETLNTDNDQGGGPPETIPYPRFKEVNDQLAELRGFKQLKDVGYDADSLRQLAEFEASFRASPVETWFAIADQIQELPSAVREVVRQHLSASDTTNAPAKPGDDTAGKEGEVPEWAKPLLTKVDEVTGKLSQREEREAEDARQRSLDGMIAKWKKLDEESGLKKSADEAHMLTFIMAHANTSQDKSLDEILESARAEWLAIREDAVGSELLPGGTNVPRTVPGSAAPINAAGTPKTLAEASARAKAFMEQNK